MKLTKNSKGSSLSLSIIVSVVILGIILLIFLLLSGALSQTTSNVTNNSQCLTLLSNLDLYSSSGDSSRIKALFDKSCSPLNKTISNNEQLINEVESCNSKAQKIIKQEKFILKNPNLCFPCSMIMSQISHSINTNELKNDFLNIKPAQLNLNSEQKQQLLLFRIENEEIIFEINSLGKSSTCNIFLNS